MFPGARHPRREGAIDVVTTVVPAVFVLAVTTVAGHFQPAAHRLFPWGQLWLVAAALPLLARRRWPLPAFLASAALTGGYYLSGYPGGPAAILPTICLFTLTRRRGPVTAGVAGAAVLLAWLAAYLATGGRVEFDARAGLFVAWLAAVVGIGTAARNRLTAMRAAGERAEEQRQRLVEQERLRIAREVHDVVAHSLAMINVQAGVAAHVADRRPEQAREALQAIKEASAAALNDLRATVAVVRSGSGADGRAPAPSLRQSAELLDHARATGLRVRVHGAPGELPAPVDAAAYRILQESLTNVVRHAERATTVDVHFGRSAGRFELTVRDDGRGDGRGAAAAPPGNGLRGMRERAEALGGTVRARAVSDFDGGFEVLAELPVEPRETG